MVRIHAIECEPCDQNRKCSWRAIKVVPKGVGATREQPLDSGHLYNPAQSSFLDDLLRDKKGIHVDNVIDLGVLQKGKRFKYFIDVANSNHVQMLLKSAAVKGENRLVFKIIYPVF